MRHTLRGFVGQSMSGVRSVRDGGACSFPPGSYTFSPPRSGYWKFVQWGPGGSGSSNGGDSGAYTEYTRFLTPADGIPLVVGSMGTHTTATFADGKVVIAGAATGTGGGAGPGVASGGDVNLDGSAGGTPGQNGLGTGGGPPGTGNGGAGAPANLPYRGAKGGNDSGPAASPGSGAGVHVGLGGDGLILVVFVRD